MYIGWGGGAYTVDTKEWVKETGLVVDRLVEDGHGGLLERLGQGWVGVARSVDVFA